MRNHETEDTCGFWKDHNDTWWTYYVEINIGDPNVKNSHIKSWLSRGNGEALRQFIDFGPFPWDYVEGRELQNILLTLYKTSKNSTDHAIATVWYDELIISSNPIPVPESVKLSMENRSTNPPESTLLIVE
jgi:hypothetical protein